MKLTVASVLETLGGGVKRGSGWMVKCPAHDDSDPSLFVTNGDKQEVVFHCQSQHCEQEAILTAIKRKISRQATTYRYRDADGVHIGDSVRYYRNGEKGFRQRNADGENRSSEELKRTPYMLPELLEGIARGRGVFIVEGEKDAESLYALGKTATTNIGGGGKWGDEHSAHLAGAKRVVIIADSDTKGIASAWETLDSVRRTCRDLPVNVLHSTLGKDITEHLVLGGRLSDLVPVERETERIEDDKPDIAFLVPFHQDPDFLQSSRPKWMIRDLWTRGGCGFIAGIPKSLKSWLALDMAFCLAHGVSYIGARVVSPVNVLYIQEEDAMTVVKDRLGKIAEPRGLHWDGTLSTGNSKSRGGRKGVVHLPPVESPGRLYIKVLKGFVGSDPEWLTWLAEVVETHSIGAIILDTMATIGGDLDMDKAQDVKVRMLDPLKRIARAFNTAVVIIHHNKKSSANGRAAANMVGSGQIHAWADCGMYVTDKVEGATGNVTLTFDVETKYGPTVTKTIRIKWGESGMWVPQEIVAETPEETSKGDSNERFKINRARAFIAEHPGMSTREVARHLGISVGTVSAARKSMT